MKAYRTFQALVIAGLGFFILERIWSGQVLLYINRRSVPVVLLAGLALVILAQIVFQDRLQASYQVLEEEHPGHAHPRPGFANLGWVVVPIVIGLLVPARPLGAGALANRGMSTTAALAARTSDSTSAVDLPAGQRNVLEWIRVFQSIPDPQTVAGQPAQVTGFVYHDPRLAAGQFMVVRFAISCCVADALGVGMVVAWPQASSLADNHWVRVSGPVQVLALEGQKVPLIAANQVEEIPEPEQPYLYP